MFDIYVYLLNVYIYMFFVLVLWFLFKVRIFFILLLFNLKLNIWNDVKFLFIKNLGFKIDVKI